MNSRDNKILAEFVRRQNILKSLLAWYEANGPYEGVTGAHLKLLMKELEEVEAGRCTRLIVCMPPGSAKSTVISKMFPGWFLARKANRTILACSYAYELIEGFGRNARNIIDLHKNELGIALKADSRAAGEWETTNGGRYFCAGVNAGIAGHRADLAFIDDPIGSAADARSQTYRDNLEKWFWDDLIPRLKPGGAVVIIANRRHEDDLVGRLIAKYPADWKVIKMPLIIETDEQEKNDALGRHKGDILWPEYFTEQKVIDARKSDEFNGLYQQDPTNEDGEYFQRDWFEPVAYNSNDELPAGLQNYAASDHALTTKEENDCHCAGPFGIDAAGDVWIYPELFWERADTLELVNEMFSIARSRKPIDWFAEDEHIKKSIQPFINQLMVEKNLYFTITGFTSSRDLQQRAQSIRGRAKQRKIHLPRFTKWYAAAMQQLMAFPLGKHDDFISFLSLIGRGLDKVVGGVVPTKTQTEEFNTPAENWKPTFGWLREQSEAFDKQQQNRFGGR